MLFLSDFKLFALVLIGSASQFFLMAHSREAPSFQCISDVEQPFAFCRRAKSLTAEHTANSYGLTRATGFRSESYVPFSFNCKDLSIFGGPADNTACCDQNFNAKITDRGLVREISPEAFAAHCTVIAA